MKWLLVSMAIWGDGAYTFAPMVGMEYSTEQQCLEQIKVIPGLRLTGIPGQPAIYYSHICLPAEAWENFTRRHGGR